MFVYLFRSLSTELEKIEKIERGEEMRKKYIVVLNTCIGNSTFFKKKILFCFVNQYLRGVAAAEELLL